MPHTAPFAITAATPAVPAHLVHCVGLPPLCCCCCRSCRCLPDALRNPQKRSAVRAVPKRRSHCRTSPAARHLRGACFLLGGALLAGLQLPRYCAHFPSGSHRTGVGRFSGHPLACSAGGSARQPYGNDGLRRCGQCHVRHFMKLSGKYLYDPNSPFRNEEYYIPVLRHIIASPRLGEPDKARPRFRLDMALKNRPGEVAADFVYTRTNGSRGRLRRISADYTAVLQLARLRGLPPGEGLHGRFGALRRYDGRRFRPPSPAGYPGRLSR